MVVAAYDHEVSTNYFKKKILKEEIEIASYVRNMNKLLTT
jgi:hypothetical protein